MLHPGWFDMEWPNLSLGGELFLRDDKNVAFV